MRNASDDYADDDGFSEIDEAMAIYKGPKTKNRDAIRAILAQLDGWAASRGFDIQEELNAVRQKRSA